MISSPVLCRIIFLYIWVHTETQNFKYLSSFNGIFIKLYNDACIRINIKERNNSKVFLQSEFYFCIYRMLKKESIRSFYKFCT